jgi:hypothetical protein
MNRVGEMEIGHDSFRGGWRVYVSYKDQIIYFQEAGKDEQIPKVRAAFLASIIAALVEDERRKPSTLEP